MEVEECRTKLSNCKYRLLALYHLLEQRRFIDRYIPGYVFFGDVQRWQGKGLRLFLDEERRQLGVETF